MPQLFDALCDLAEPALAFHSCTQRAALDGAPAEAAELRGSLVQLSSATASLHVGILAAPDDCAVLATRLLGPRSGAQLIRGAICELAYLLAGGVRRRLLGFGTLAVGQPAFIYADVETRRGWQRHETPVLLDGLGAKLVCLTRSEAVFAVVTRGA